MSKHNFVLIYAQISKEPRIITDLEDKPIKAMFSTNIIRGKRDFGNNIDNLRYDNPAIMTGNPALINIISKLKKNDVVLIKGAITTRDVNKTTTCPDCGEKKSTPGNVVYISPISITKFRHAETDEEALALLKENCEISNICMLVGTVCKKPSVYDEGRVPVIQYSLAVNRKYHLKDGRENERTDYPIIKAYGNKALQDGKVLRVNSEVLVDGIIQTRTIERKTLCDCGREYKWNDSAMEIVPYSTEYLTNCKTQAEIELEDLEKLNKLSKTILLKEEESKNGIV